MIASEYIKAFSKNKNYYLWFMFYLIAHGGILLIPNAIYWDDWILYRTAPEVILDTFSQAGSMFNFAGYLHISLLTIGPWIYKALTFLLMFASGLLLNQILKRHTSLQSEYRFFIVLLFLVLPFNIARVALIDFGYTLSYFLFFLAWMLMSRYRVTALILFFFSFNTNSLLVFYAIPFFDMLYKNGGMTHWKKAIELSMRHIDFILLPFIYLFVKVYYFSPNGSYSGYNESYSLLNIIQSASLQYGEAQSYILNLDIKIWFLSIAMAVVTFIVIKGNSIRIDTLILKGAISWILLGIVILFLGLFPYWILGYSPTFTEWTSRHQILMPLGCSLVIIASWSLLKNNLVIISSIIGLSLAINVTTYKDFFVDWQKQGQIINAFRESQEIREASLIAIDDRTKKLNAINRGYRFYEWNGMMEFAFGDETRFGVPHSGDKYPAGVYPSIEKHQISSFYKSADYLYNRQSPPVFVVIDIIPPQGWKDKIFPQLSVALKN